MRGRPERSRGLALVLVLTAGAVCGLALTAGGLASREASVPPARLAPPTSLAERPSAAAAAALAESPAPPSAPALPEAYSGTEVDGWLGTDAQGRFVPTLEALRLFEYFFTAGGEESDAEIAARIEAEVRQRLSGRAAEDALALLDRFLAYRERARELEERGVAPADLERRLQWERELRREVFGADTARALFAEREAQDLVALEQRRIWLDPDLSDAEKRARLDAAAAGLPEPARAARERRLAPLRAVQEVAALRAAGAPPEAIFAARERHLGRAAAERLARLDTERALRAATATSP